MPSIGMGTANPVRAQNQKYYASLSPEAREALLAKTREYKRKSRAAMSPEDRELARAEQRARDAARQGRPRTNITPSREQRRAYKLSRKYKMTQEQYDVLLATQGGVCAICGEPETVKQRGVTQPLAVDHDHATEKNRGLCCSRCNCAIGLVRESPSILHAILAYLERHR